MAADGRGDPSGRLLVVDPSVEEAEVEGARTVAAAWPGPSRIVRPALEPGERLAPGVPYDDDAIVVMGSRASVHDDLVWLRELGAWLAPVVSGEVDRPLLGICFGHQLVAALAGGGVADLREDGSKVVRFAETRFSGSRLVTGSRSLPVVASHREVVTELPDPLAVTASREDARIDSFEHPVRPLFAVQFHPEAGPEFVGRAGLDAAGLTGAVREAGRSVLSAFAREARAWLSR